MSKLQCKCTYKYRRPEKKNLYAVQTSRYIHSHYYYSKVHQNSFRCRQIQTIAQKNGLRHHAPGREPRRRLEALPRERHICYVVRMRDLKAPRARTAPGERPACEREVDVHARACTRASGQPRVEVDEDGADEVAALECSVAGDVRVVDGQLDDLGRSCIADEGVDDDAAVVCRLNVGRKWRVDGRAVNS